MADLPGNISGLLNAQLEQSYRQLPISLAVNLANGVILVAVLWGGVATSVLLSWLLLLVIVVALRYGSRSAFGAAAGTRRFDPPIWRRYFVAGGCAMGIVWGSAGVLLFDPQSFPNQVFLAFVIGGMVAGAIPLLSGVAGAFPCFALPAVVPIGVRMLAEGDRVHLIMGLMVVIFGAAMFASAFQVRRVFRDAEDLRQRLTSTIEAGHALERMVRRDTLTGIANRRLFEEKLDEEWRRARRDRESLSVITADIDHFKQFNDRYGHPAGDHCLTVVAQAMAQSLARPGDVVARIGGEEFAFLLPQTSLEGAIAVAEHIRQKIVDLNLQHDASPVSQWVTVSFGVASSDQRSITSPADLLRASDVALYDAKRGGRNRTAAFRA